MNEHTPIVPRPRGDLHETDLSTWSAEQARLLSEGRFEDLDIANLIDELETMGASERNEVSSRLATILEHLLKLRYGLQRDPERGWFETVQTQRDDLESVLRLSPSLRPRIPDLTPYAYTTARKRAMRSFRRYEPEMATRYDDALPDACPFTIEQILGEDYLPDGPGKS